MGARKEHTVRGVERVGRQIKVQGSPGKLPVLLYFEEGVGAKDMLIKGKAMLTGEWSWTIYYANLAF